MDINFELIIGLLVGFCVIRVIINNIKTYRKSFPIGLDFCKRIENVRETFECYTIKAVKGLMSQCMETDAYKITLLSSCILHLLNLLKWDIIDNLIESKRKNLMFTLNACLINIKELEEYSASYLNAGLWKDVVSLFKIVECFIPSIEKYLSEGYRIDKSIPNGYSVKDIKKFRYLFTDKNYIEGSKWIPRKIRYKIKGEEKEFKQQLLDLINNWQVGGPLKHH